jgi:hypothetical protein
MCDMSQGHKWKDSSDLNDFGHFEWHNDTENKICHLRLINNHKKGHRHIYEIKKLRRKTEKNQTEFCWV